MVFRAYRARELLGFGWRLLASGLLEQGYQSLADLVVGKRFSPAQLGLVSQGKKYPQAVGVDAGWSHSAGHAVGGLRVQDDRARVKRLVRRALKTSTFLIAPAMALFACLRPLARAGAARSPVGDAVPFMQAYCMVYALLPIHTTNLQALNGMGRSDLFLKLELVKKAYGIAALLFCAFVWNHVRALVVSYLVTGVISTFVNAWPNKRVIGYSRRAGARHRARVPAFGGGFPCRRPGRMRQPRAWATVLAQVVAFAFVYLGRGSAAPSWPSPTCCAPRAASSRLASSGAYVPIRRGALPARILKTG